MKKSPTQKQTAKLRLPHLASRPPVPVHRLLRGYAFDPSLTCELETAAVSEILYKVPWEPLPDPAADAEHAAVAAERAAEQERERQKEKASRKAMKAAKSRGGADKADTGLYAEARAEAAKAEAEKLALLEQQAVASRAVADKMAAMVAAGKPVPAVRGLRGEYVEVVDYDPASHCFYAPVDLDHPLILAQNGLKPSDGNPQFHQQMVYAVAMTTIDRFERALGRRALWADRWDKAGHGQHDVFVQRLRIYPHAFRDANAFYSRSKGALLFGYFPAAADHVSSEMPGGMVFTCLSHDIIAHETTHALLDGFHEYFMEATNPDVLAFHEGFADIVALLQHFSFPEQLRHQIAKTQGFLAEKENLLGQLATQFGRASGSRGALRDYIGKYDEEKKKWIPHEPKPSDLEAATEVHERGAILVAAVFDAFLSIYGSRTRDLLRLATGGGGVLPKEGALHPDLVNRLAMEAAKTAGHVLKMCIRALDYCPPVDLTFGEYLRALVTADMNLIPDDALGYRVAMIEAFRRRGIYPENLRTLSEESLCWSRPEEDPNLTGEETKQMLTGFIEDVHLRQHVDRLRYLKSRSEVWGEMRDICQELHEAIRLEMDKPGGSVLSRLTGLVLDSASPQKAGATNIKTGADSSPTFKVHTFREARRQRGDGRILNQVFITLLQTAKHIVDGDYQSFRCGSTMVIDLDEMAVSYVIRKSSHDETRFLRTREFRKAVAATFAFSQTFLGSPATGEAFAALHQH